MSGVGTLIVGAAPVADGASHYASLIGQADIVIAADGGLLTCLEAGRVPDVCVGDFDSTSDESLAVAAEAGAEIRRFPTVKDVSDLDLALDVARERGVCPVILCAAFSGRLDHTLSALGTLVSAADLGARADEPQWVVVPLASEVRRSCRLAVPIGSVVSVLALSGPAVVSADGFAYPMSEMPLEPLSSHGLSNVTQQAAPSVTVHAGAVLVIIERGVVPLPLQSPVVITDTV